MFFGGKCRSGILGPDQSGVELMQPRPTAVSDQFRAVSIALRPQSALFTYRQAQGKAVRFVYQMLISDGDFQSLSVLSVATAKVLFDSFVFLCVWS